MGLLSNIFKKKERILINYNSEDLNKGERLQHALNENAFLKGKLARIDSEKAEDRQGEEEKAEEKEKIRNLNQQAEELSKKDIKPLSFTKILKYQNSKKGKKKKIKFTTFNGEKDLGNVEDFVMMPDGALGCVSNGEVIWASRDLNHVFFWVAGLNNFAKNCIIPLCIDKDNKFMPNLHTEEMSELVLTSDKKFKINRFNKKPMYDLISENLEDNAELGEELEGAESTIAEQQQEINEKDREAKLHKIRADKAQSDFSLALNKVSEMESTNNQLIRQNTTLLQVKEINEELIDKMERVVKKWGNRIEDEIGTTKRDKEWEDLKEKLSWAKQNMPQTIQVMPEKEPVPGLIDENRPRKP